jgi:hypothetical protein
MKHESSSTHFSSKRSYAGGTEYGVASIKVDFEEPVSCLVLQACNQALSIPGSEGSLHGRFDWAPNGVLV